MCHLNEVLQELLYLQDNTFIHVTEMWPVTCAHKHLYTVTNKTYEFSSPELKSEAMVKVLEPLPWLTVTSMNNFNVIAVDSFVTELGDNLCFYTNYCCAATWCIRHNTTQHHSSISSHVPSILAILWTFTVYKLSYTDIGLIGTSQTLL